MIRSSTAWWPETGQESLFISPSIVSAGRGSAGRVAELLTRQLSIRPTTVLVAIDDVVARFGLADSLLAGLAREGFDVVVCNAFGTEPTGEVIDAAAAKARAAKAEVVIGIGGGSVLDSAKLISLLVRNGGQTADWLGVVTPPEGVATLVLIPTTSGTGSEATRIAMVTVNGAKRASSCVNYVPTAAVLDPDLLASLPAGIVAATGMDALAHAVESLMSTTASPMSAHHAFAAIQLLILNLEAAAAGDQDARAGCLWGAHLAGQALNAGVVVGHSIAYCLAYENPMPHGTSCALSLPYCIAYNSTLDPALARSLAAALTVGRSDSLREAAGEVLELARRLGLPTTLDEGEVPRGVESRVAERCVREYPRPTNPRPLERRAIEALVAAMRTGDLDAAFAIHPRAAAVTT